MFATKQYIRPFWQGFFLTATFFLLGFGTAKAVTEQPVDYSAAELEELVGPIALYPDDLIGIVLPASSYPLQIVEAARYLEELETNPDLQPDEDWDDSVVALLNYPEIIELMNEDLDWTWNLGAAVVDQQADVLDAIQDFRGRAVLAGNLESDDRQTISVVDDVIEVRPVDPEVIYVPYYEPSRVVVYQPSPVYYYYPRAYPVYYYPYPSHYSFSSGFFWGVTTAYTIGWLTDRVHYHYYGYASHPYYGHYYAPRYYSRRAHRVRHHAYSQPRSHDVYNRTHYGNSWRPSRRHGSRPGYRQADRRQTTAANYTRSNRRQGSVDDGRVRSGGSRPASNRSRSSQERQATQARDTRKRNTVTRSTDRRRQTDRSSSNPRVALTDQSARKVTSRRTRSAGSRSGSNQIIDTRKERGNAARSGTRTPRRAGQQADTRRRTARETRDTNSVRVNRSVTRVAKPTRSTQRAQTRAQPRSANTQKRRQASRSAPGTQRRSSKSRTVAKPAARSKTRLASAARSTRSSGQRAQSRGGSSPRRGHRK